MMATIHNTPPPPIPMGHMNPPPNSANFGQQNQFQSLQFKPFKPPDGDYDGKRLRKSVMRKTVDYNSSVIQMLESRIWQRDERDRPALPADISYASHILPPPAYLTNPVNAVVTKFVRSSTNKAKCPIFCLAWTPEGRRLVTGASSGEFTLWNGLTFNFETILQAHESSVRAMVWSHNDQWMVTGDTSGYIKYWQSNMNNVKMFQAHKDPVRGLSFSPSDLKIASGSDDGTVRIWDFYRCQEENVLIGHGSDVKCVDWHPSKSLLASGSKDNQQPIKLWDPRTGSALAQLHAHKSTVMDLKWNSNGMWLCSASRDHLLKLFDIRNFSQELQVFRGHKKEASSIAWHPQHEGHFASGGSDGSILFWHVGYDKEVGAIESAHDGIIWDMAWHPLGHILCSGSNDHASKFWTRNRPGDKMRDRYNLNTLPPGVVGDDCVDIDDIPMSVGPYAPSGAIPGMGPEDKIEETEIESTVPETIPGLEFDALSFERMMKKTPYAKPIPKTFQAAWNAAGGLDDLPDQDNTSWVIIEMEKLFNKFPTTEGEPFVTETGINFPPGTVPLSEVKADAIAYYGFYIPLAKVPANEIQDAFAFFDEEEALSQLTSDADFARKLVREKRGLYNPTSNQGLEDKKDSDSKSSRPPLIQNNSNMPPPNHFKNAPPNQNYPQQNYQNQQSFNQPPFYSQPPNRPPNGREDFDYNREEGWNRNYNRDNFKQNSQRQNSQDFQNRMPHNQRGFGPPMGDGRNRDGYDQRNDDRGQNYNDRMDGYGNEDYRQMQNYSDDYPDRGRRGDDYSDRGRRGDDYPNRGRRGDYPNRRDDYPDRRGDDNDRRDNYNEKRNDYQDRGRRGGFQNPRGRGGGYNDRRDNFQGDRDARRSFQRDSYGNEDDDYCQEENQPQGKDWGDRLQGRPRERDYDGDRRNKRRDGDDRRGGGGGRSSGKMRSRGGGRGRSRGDGGGNRPHRNRDNY